MKPDEFIQPILDYFKPDYYMTEVIIGGCRADLLVFSRGEIIGIEIKSDKDTFIRLRGQLPQYYEACSRVYIAVSNDREVPKDVPSFVGILNVSEDRFIEIRPGIPIFKNEKLIKRLWERAKKGDAKK